MGHRLPLRWPSRRSTQTFTAWGWAHSLQDTRRWSRSSSRNYGSSTGQTSSSSAEVSSHHRWPLSFMIIFRFSFFIIQVKNNLLQNVVLDWNILMMRNNSVAPAFLASARVGESHQGAYLLIHCLVFREAWESCFEHNEAAALSTRSPSCVEPELR